jgi:hypothetical protein
MVSRDKGRAATRNCPKEVRSCRMSDSCRENSSNKMSSILRKQSFYEVLYVLKPGSIIV